MFTRCIGKKILENYDDDTVAPHARGIGTSHTQKPSGKSASRNVPYFNDIEKWRSKWNLLNWPKHSAPEQFIAGERHNSN